jgi:hypothetical protein
MRAANIVVRPLKSPALARIVFVRTKTGLLVVHPACVRDLPIFDSRLRTPIFAPVIRLLIALMSVFSLALSPVAANAAPAGQDAMAGCVTQKDMPAKPADRSKMDCCTPVCQLSPAAALLADGDTSANRIVSRGEMHAPAGVQTLKSFAPTAVDPPPRA